MDEQPRLRVEIVCWKVGWRWALGVEVSEAPIDQSHIRVIHEGTSLTLDDSRQGRWYLNGIGGKVEIRLNGDVEDDVVEVNLDRNPDGYLLFKLIGKGKDQGRLMRGATSGSFLAVAPIGWHRDEQVSGPVPYGPENVSFDGFQAHFFELEPDNPWRIAFLTGEGRHIVVETSTACFALIGNPLENASKDVGPLFGRELPRLRALAAEAWKDVGTVVVGEEGEKRGRRGWRTEWCPGKADLEVELPRSVSDREAGWFFVRIYDEQTNLMESLDFRFVKALKEICIAPHPLLPGLEGHGPVRVDFVYESGCSVRLEHSRANRLPVQVENDTATVTIPPEPAWDETRWIASSKKGAEVQLTILLGRLWWTIAEEEADDLQMQWMDKPVSLPREWFAATSKREIWLRFPRPRWIREVRAGFDWTRSRPHRPEVTARHGLIPLREFRDSSEVEDREGQHFLKVWLPPVSDDPQWPEQTVGVVFHEDHQTRSSEPRGMNVAPARVATVLTQLRKVTSGAEHELLVEVYDRRPRGRGKHGSAPADFVREALCTIALVSELLASSSRSLALHKKWVGRAHCAKDKSPDVMSNLRLRFEALKLQQPRGGRYRA